LLFGAGLPMYSSYASFFRNQDVARYFIAPANVLVGSTTLVRKTLHGRQPYIKVGEDAKRAATKQTRPLVVIFVVGETARAANFSLGGYARETNPLLKQKDIYYYTDVHSCGTATAVSVPCMFSDLPRSEFKLNAADHRDTVLDILQRAGVAVSWIDNQSGCKKVCARVPTEEARSYHPDSCKDGECLDDALLHALTAKLAQTQRDALIVLHAMGSHGPTYFRRVPPDHEVFKPTCPTQQIETCTDEQIVNSYDNSIAYTDYVLAGLIDALAAQQDRVDAVLLYVSDHGESLGENGLYLHGQPYLIAPEVQKKVPMLLWFSRGAPARLKLDGACLRTHLNDTASHDNVSHTLLGVHDVVTTVYRPELDLLKTCRTLR
ncbi:MAG TPA: sulfatase-like hydrolase/transferase, partial [Steroidobacteraceae bacterium]|nr:sulfatase-like hydrolase/transferase [Steroidobacteraceae bacterium]